MVMSALELPGSLTDATDCQVLWYVYDVVSYRGALRLVHGARSHWSVFSRLPAALHTCCTSTPSCVWMRMGCPIESRVIFVRSLSMWRTRVGAPVGSVMNQTEFSAVELRI